MGTVELARLQFALTVGVHYLLVALTLGLVVMVAINHTRWVRTGDPALKQATKYWGTLYVINYAVGIAAGIAMEYQLSANWSGLENMAASVFGAPLAVETVVAFFVESTFLALWIFGWQRLPAKAHLACIWIVAAAAYMSAIWALLANGFMQNPVAYEMRGGELHLDDPLALFTNANAWIAVLHVIGGAIGVGGFFMLGVSVLLRRRGRASDEFLRHSMRMGAHAALWGTVLVGGSGALQMERVEMEQPIKQALVDGKDAELADFQQALVKRFGDGVELPSGPLVQISAFSMIIIGLVLLVVAIWTLISLRDDRMLTRRGLQRTLVFVMALPFVANIAGWVLREYGRQPFVIDDILTTEQALTPSLTTTQLTVSLVVLGLLVTALLVLDWWLLGKTAMRGPQRADLWEQAPEEAGYEDGEHDDSGRGDGGRDDEKRDGVLI
ncbi:cytochrome ubiquinol oxidase subunit I [Streptomyces sp. NBC_01381]|uniref:cytochrome ubiquinol oxidase subunit I n=1 Tax=Streptomyces sp. NBC_01381 TaxID=2903845 RepID=UPI0022555631|nr:cytochrome ubiquinol oxidase subunit I [Streptomyces sp. NBC_01381]MCX4667135.1 cytochrome ubiquinol oxidase subunit I [Streptomyces sp. NBC_01381]